MPIYEYHCNHCQHAFEALQKMSDAPLQQCPACHQSTLVKKVSAAAFRLSGSGWYETDFKSGKKKNLAGDVSKSQQNQAQAKGKAQQQDKNTQTASASNSAASTASN